MNLNDEISTVNKELQRLWSDIRLDELVEKHHQLLAQSQQPDFWNNSIAAQDHMKRLNKLQLRIEPWQQLKKQLDEAKELSALSDVSLEADLKKQIDKITLVLADLKHQLSFSGPFDDHDAVLSIHAGAGGTDAQDWAGMLLRMYSRWADKDENYSVKVLDETPGEEAGLKSVSLEISGSFVYGKLKSEHGVHRLVRLSPFNANNLRQTSFAKVEVLPKIDEPESVPIDEKDLKIDVFRAGGHGGQSVNTTDSAVRLTHMPTGIVVSIQNERSQLQNKETAMTILRSKLAQLQLEQHAEKISELKGPNEQAAWGNQIRSYVLHPYKMVKDLRTKYETSDVDAVLDGNLEPFIDAYLEQTLAQ